MRWVIFKNDIFFFGLALSDQYRSVRPSVRPNIFRPSVRKISVRPSVPSTPYGPPADAVRPSADAVRPADAARQNFFTCHVPFLTYFHGLMSKMELPGIKFPRGNPRNNPKFVCVGMDLFLLMEDGKLLDMSRHACWGLA